MELAKVRTALQRKGYSFSYFERGEEAAVYLNEQIRNRTVGFGDSETLTSLGLFQSLSLHNRVWDPQQAKDTPQFLDIAKSALTADIFLTSVNALAETGELVNLDGTGNRIAGSLFGHEKVFFVAGVNKLVPTLEQAIQRVRNWAAPRNAQRLGLNTPCAKGAGQCYDCASPDRICNALTIHFCKMRNIEMEIVLIGQPLGL